MSNYTPIVPQTGQSIVGLGISKASNTTLNIAAGEIFDSTNVFYINVPSALVLNSAVVGLNGIDTGAFAASKMYYIYIIADASGYNVPGCIMSLSAVQPLMPAGLYPSNYSLFRRIGSWASNGSTQFPLMYQSGTGSERIMQYDVEAATPLSAGNSTTLANISLLNVVPAINGVPVKLDVIYTPASAGNAFSYGSGGTASATLPLIKGQVNAVVIQNQVDVITQLVTSNPSFAYKVGNAGDAVTANVFYYIDFI